MQQKKQDLKQLDNVSGQSTHDEFLKNTGQMYLDGKMFTTSPTKHTSAPLEKMPNSHYSRAVFRANHTALLESVKVLVTNVICGESSGESLAILDQNGCWVKMYEGYCQVMMDGSLEMFSRTWAKWGMMLDGVVTEQTELEQSIRGKECSLLPTPMASDSIAWKKAAKNNAQVTLHKTWKRGGTVRSIYYPIWLGRSPTQAAEYNEMIMGFPMHWTDLDA